MTRLLIIVPLCACLACTADRRPAGQPTSRPGLAAFLKDCADKAAAAERAKSMTVKGKDGWLFLGRELHHLSVGRFWGDEATKVSRASRPEWADPLAPILDFKEQLDRAGIELLVVPVPAKAAVYPDRLSDAIEPDGDGRQPRVDLQDKAFYELLAGKGVKVLDLLPHFVSARADDAQEGAVYCKQDSHWSGRACELTAKLIAGQIADRPWMEDAKTQHFATRRRSVRITGDLWRGLKDTSVPREILKLRFVGTGTGSAFRPVPPDRGSPILLLGDSHCLVFHVGGDMHAEGAGLADQLAAELGLAVDQLGVRGSGATQARIGLLRRARRDTTYLSGKKLIIWCFGAREFTESTGWRQVSIIK